MRLFFAVAPPESQRREIALCVEQCGGAEHGRLVPPENLHLTLAFLGEVAESRRADLEAVLAGLRGVSLFEVEWGGLECFPNVGRARVGVLGTPRGGEELGSLARSLGERLPEDLRPEEGRRFRPHLTVARYRQPPPREALEQLRRRLAPFSWRCSVDRVRLLRSHLEPSGARYVELATVTLEGP